jgi:hypothetical protein
MSDPVSLSEGTKDLEAWREIHKELTNAVLIAKEAVAAKKLQRRFWMEEICANLTEEGKLTHTSVWKKPMPQKRNVAKKTATKKRKKVDKKSSVAASKKTKQEKQEQANGPAAKKKRLKLTKIPSATPAPEPVPKEANTETQATSDGEEKDGGEAANKHQPQRHDPPQPHDPQRHDTSYWYDSQQHDPRYGSNHSSSYDPNQHQWEPNKEYHSNYMVSCNYYQQNINAAFPLFC